MLNINELLNLNETLNGADMAKMKRLAVLVFYNFNCIYCGLLADTIDHIIPQSKGGSDEISNLVACCQRCNCSKNASLLPDKVMNQIRCLAWISEPKIEEIMQIMAHSELEARKRRDFFEALGKPYLHPLRP